MIDLRAELMLQALRGFQPDAVLIDHMPVGAMGELKPFLDHATREPRRMKVVLGLRDIIDRPAVVRRAWRDLGAYDYLPLYDAVLVYGSRTVYDASAAYALGPVAREVDYCGYVSPPPGRSRAVPGCPDPYVLMLGGGGGDAFPLASAFLEALGTLNGELGMDGVVLTGPNMAAAERESLLSRAAANVHVGNSYDDATQWIRGACAVVTMAGYNSLCEVLRWRKKALVVPRPGPSAEQQMRSSLFSRRNLIRLLAPEALTSHRLAADLIHLLADATVPDARAIPALNGARRTARALLRPEPQPRRYVNGRAGVRSAETALRNRPRSPAEIGVSPL